MLWELSLSLMQHQHKPILLQLKESSGTTIELKLQCRPNGENLLGYSDADWANDMDDRHPTTGKQTTVALSTAEAEYVALGSATQEAIWVYQLLNDLKIDTKGSIKIMEDNQSTITMAKSSEGHKRTKHIDIKHHFIRETVQTGKLLYRIAQQLIC